jgi:hypothetical protein
MARFQDALSQAAPGDFQSVYDISKAYHHLLLHPDSYELVGFCVVDEEGKERFYHYVVVVFGLGSAGQLLGWMMRLILRKLLEIRIRNVMYVDDGWVVASTKEKSDADYAIALFFLPSADSKADCQRLRKHFLTPPPPLPPSLPTTLKVSCWKSPVTHLVTNDT